MGRECFTCFRQAKYRVAGHQDVGDNIWLACHFHLQQAVTELLASIEAVVVSYP